MLKNKIKEWIKSLLLFIVLLFILLITVFLLSAGAKAKETKEHTLQGEALKNHLSLIAYHGKDAEVVYCPKGYDKLCYFRRNGQWMKFIKPKG